MKYIGISLIYIAFFALIGFTVWFTNSKIPLLFLIFTPTFSSKSE
jgi:hypothetical protein